MEDEAEYVCGSCGEAIVIPIDFTAGPQQAYIEDCPVCCCANLIQVSIDRVGRVSLSSELE